MGININSGFSVGAPVPIDERLVMTKEQMLNANDNIMPAVYMTVCADDGALYLYNKTNEANAETGKFVVMEAGEGGDSAQSTTMPEASADNVGDVVQYVGDTTEDFTKGYFYESVYDEETGEYSWEPIETQVPVVDADANVQAPVMPEASAETEGAVIQYVGETNEEFTKGYFYECVYDEETGEYTWEPINTQDAGEGGVAGEPEIDADVTSNVEVGGIASGTTFPAGTSVTDIINQLLNKYFAPTASLAMSPATTMYATGNSAENVVLTANVTKNTNDVTSVTFYSGETVLETITEGVAAGGTFTHTVADPVTDTTTFKVVVTDDIEEASATRTITFVNPYYYGISATGEVADETGLTESVTAKGTKTFAYTAANEYLVFMYPEAYGALTSIKDANSFENIDSFNKSTLEISGTSYNVYVSKTPVTCTNFNYTFK